MEAIILAGGLGTRLKAVVPDLPKPMAPIGSSPFLSYIFEYLFKQGIKKVVLATGYKHEETEKYFGSIYKDIVISYSIETEPLGTGGAIKKALEKVESNMVLILNGDTFFFVDLKQLYQQHILLNSDLTLTVKPMKFYDRYGSIIISDNKIVNFLEKKYQEFGYINGGVYLSNINLFDKLPLPAKFSFESDFIEKYFSNFNFSAYISDTYFVDIGIPEDYQKAMKELMNYI